MTGCEITQEVLNMYQAQICKNGLRAFSHYKGCGPEISEVQLVTDPLGIVGKIEYGVALLVSNKYDVAFGQHDFSGSHEPPENLPAFGARARNIKELERSIKNLSKASKELALKLERLAKYTFSL
jgi:hypothetical protein